MNCPRCSQYIVPEFYCTNCGHVPEKTPRPNYGEFAQINIPPSLIEQPATPV